MAANCPKFIEDTNLFRLENHSFFSVSKTFHFASYCLKMIYYATSVYRPSSFLFIRRLYSSTNHLLHHFLSTPEGVQLLPSATTLSSFARGIKIRPSGCSKFRSMSASRTAASPLSCDNDVQYVTLLDGKHDDHGGAIVEMKKDMNMDKETFVSALKASLSLWSQQGKKGIWIKLPIELVHLVEPAVKEGFRYHHAEPDYMMLVHWIPETGSTIPANASHRVRIGAFVMNDCGEVLVVQEKSGKFRGTGVWKFPTGVVDEGEDICVAAVREVKEETGIDAEFVEVLAFRQSHKSYFQKSDLFFVCMLRPLSLNIKIQDLEIEAAQWMRFEEYAGQPFVESHELFRYVVKICLKKRNGGYSGFLPVPVESVFSSEKSGFLYLSKSASIDD